MPANPPPAAPDRRRILMALTAATGSLAGCQTLDDDATTGTSPATTTDAQDGPTTVETTRTQDESTRETTRSRTTDRPRAPACPDCTLLSTNYGGDDGMGHVLEPVDDDLDAAIAVLTDSWRRAIDDRELATEARRFLADTAFPREHVVAVQFREHSCCQRLSLTRFERDDDRVRLRLEAPEFGSLQAENEKLVLVRTATADRGPPASAVARVVVGEEFAVTITPDCVDR